MIGIYLSIGRYIPIGAKQRSGRDNDLPTARYLCRMKRKEMRILWVIATLLWAHSAVVAQETFRIVTFNAENLCDTIHDEGFNDWEFLPQGGKQWTEARYRRKLNAVAETISEAGGTDWPWLVALCEVENSCVTEALLATTRLGEVGYAGTTSCGNDPRGMDVAFLYLKDRFRITASEEWQIPFTDADSAKRSRPVLYVRGRFYTGIPLDIMVVHLPSRRGGTRASAPARRDAVRFIRGKCDSLLRLDPERDLLIMGDFNATPYDRDMRNHFVPLKANGSYPQDAPLVDITSVLSAGSYPGSYYFGGQTQQLDRFVVSRGMLARTASKGVKVKIGSVTNVKSLHMRRLTDGRVIPLRTYGGNNYLGGASDHLAVSALFWLPK